MIQTVKEQKADYNLFISTITEKVKEMMGNEYSVQIHKVLKNNSLELDSLVVRKEDKNFAPNIYMMPYYESYMEGTSIHELAERLSGIYQHCNVPVLDEKFSYSMDEMQPYIIYRLVNYERNHSLLEKVPHLKYLDLAVTFHCLVRNDDEGIGTIRITNEHMELWEASLTQIVSLAKINTKRLFPYSLRSMDEVMKGMLKDEFLNVEEELSEELLDQFLYNSIETNHNQMYILSNQKNINGASCLLYEDVLREFSEHINSDFYILPSSIHEIILVPCEKHILKENLKEMVKDVNCTQVAPEEVLSDNVYYFSREKNIIMI